MEDFWASLDTWLYKWIKWLYWEQGPAIYIAYTPHISIIVILLQEAKQNPLLSLFFSTSPKLPSMNKRERKIHISSSRAPKIMKFLSKLLHIMGKTRPKFQVHWWIFQFYKNVLRRCWIVTPKISNLFSWFLLLV